MTKDEALWIAVDYVHAALISHDNAYGNHPAMKRERDEIVRDLEAIRQALAEPPNSTTDVVEPVAFEDWLKSQHGDPEEIGFLQALRVAYYAGADSRTAPPKRDLMSDMKTKLSTALWCDLKTDNERAAWLLLGRGYETGVVCKSIQNQLAMAYSRLIERHECETCENKRKRVS